MCKLLISSFGLLLCLLISDIHAAGLFVDAGPGFWHSWDSTVAMARLEKETSDLFGFDSYYELAYARWNGPNRNRAFGASRGLRWGGNRRRYHSFAAGAAYISRETRNLGTLFQFYFRYGYMIRLNDVEIGLGVMHYSNGKLIFHWAGPNNSDNFLTLSAGFRF